MISASSLAEKRGARVRRLASENRQLREILAEVEQHIEGDEEARELHTMVRRALHGDKVANQPSRRRH